MTTVKHPKFLASLRTLLLWILKCGPVHRIVAQIISRLSTTFHSLSVLVLRRDWERRPPTSQNKDSVLKNTKVKPDNDLDHPSIPGGENKPLHTPLPFIVEPNGEIVSLENISYSLYANSDHIRDANRSTQSLHSSIRSHKSAVSSRPLSPSWEKPSRSPSPSIHPRNSASWAFGIDSPPRTAWPSISLPTRTLSQPPDIDFTDIDITPPIPGTLLADPATSDNGLPVYLKQQLITPVMPEATQRYHRRPRM